MSLNLIELNELNFDVVQRYLDAGYALPNFHRLLSGCVLHTKSEQEYSQLEPWIQWVSAHTGKTYAEHQIFRLGDIVNFDHEQVTDVLLDNGLKVGCVSPMNMANRSSRYDFFIPDPWTDTPSDSGLVSRLLASSISRFVNNNAVRSFGITAYLKLSIALLMVLSPKDVLYLARKLIWACKKKWRKAIFLDLVLFRVFSKLSSAGKTDFNILFLNAGAHIQHHYFLNSKVLGVKPFQNPSWYLQAEEDPVLELLTEYDRIVGELFSVSAANIIATGLTQVPYEIPVFYYRLRNHSDFLSSLGIHFERVHPRMTRDFLIEFVDEKAATAAGGVLAEVSINGVALFGEVDVRGSSIFAVSSYPHEIKPNDQILGPSLTKPLNASQALAFVAIKNGHHSGNGFVYLDSDTMQLASSIDGQHISSLFGAILQYFEIRPTDEIIS